MSDFEMLSASQMSSLEQATAKYQAALPGSAAEALLLERGITADVAATFRLGVVDDPEVEHVGARGRLAIPYLSPVGVVGLRFRWLPGADNEKAKYWQPPGSRTHLYNVRDFHVDSPHIAICEGELDALVLSGLCDIPAVGISGTNAWKSYFRDCFEDYETVFVVMDLWKHDEEGNLIEDPAGRKAAQRLKNDLRNAQIVDLKEGDVNEVYLKHGREAIRGEFGL